MRRSNRAHHSAAPKPAEDRPRHTAAARALARLVAAALAVDCVLVVPAGATCGSANCFLITGTQEGVGNQGLLTVDLSYRYVVNDRKMSGTHSVGEVLTPKVDFESGVLEPDHHREIATQNTLVEVDLAYGLSERLTLAAALPLINERDHEHWDDVGTPGEHFTRSDGSNGFGDVRLGLRYALLVRTKNLLVGGLGLKAPTGEYRLLDSEGAINEPTIQPGTGAFSGIGSLYYTHQIAPGRSESFLSASYQANGENDLKYAFGDETQAGAGFRSKAGKQVTWSMQVNGRRTEHDRFLGGPVPSTGSTILSLTPGIRVEGSSGVSLYGFVQVPVYEKVNQVNLAPGLGLLLGISRVF